MTLRPELVRPCLDHGQRAVVAGVTLLGLGLAVAAAAPMLVIAAHPLPAPLATRAAVAQPEPAAAPVAAVVPVPAVLVVETPAARASELGFVVHAGGAAYLSVAELVGGGYGGADEDTGEAVPRHGKRKLSEADGVYAAVAPVAARDVPLAHRAWAGRRVALDDGCTATVGGFAVVWRLTGDLVYAGAEGAAWTAASVAEHGAAVLGARLDGCKATAATYGRDASLPPIVVPEEISDPALADAARAALLASAPARAAAVEWSEHQMDGTWLEQATLDTKVVRHPTTGARFVSIHARTDLGCGAPAINVWGLFRAGADGALEVVQLRPLGELHSVDKLVDLEGDGALEIIGAPWLGLDRALARASGQRLVRLTLPFYGCPC